MISIASIVFFDHLSALNVPGLKKLLETNSYRFPFSGFVTEAGTVPCELLQLM